MVQLKRNNIIYSASVAILLFRRSDCKTREGMKNLFFLGKKLVIILYLDTLILTSHSSLDWQVFGTKFQKLSQLIAHLNDGRDLMDPGSRWMGHCWTTLEHDRCFWTTFISSSFPNSHEKSRVESGSWKFNFFFEFRIIILLFELCRLLRSFSEPIRSRRFPLSSNTPVSLFLIMWDPLRCCSLFAKAYRIEYSSEI